MAGSVADTAEAIGEYIPSPIKAALQAPGAAVGLLGLAVDPEAYWRAYDLQSDAIDKGDDFSTSEQIRSAPGLGSVIRESMSPRQPGERGWGSAAKGVGALAVDIATDPSSYLGGGVVKAGRLAKVAAGGERAVAAAPELARAAKGIDAAVEGFKEAERIRRIGRGEAGLEATSRIVGSPVAGAVYGPEILTGVARGIESGDYAQAALTGGLGAIVGHGIAGEVRGFRGGTQVPPLLERMAAEHGIAPELASDVWPTGPPSGAKMAGFRTPLVEGEEAPFGGGGLPGVREPFRRPEAPPFPEESSARPAEPLVNEPAPFEQVLPPLAEAGGSAEAARPALGGRVGVRTEARGLEADDVAVPAFIPRNVEQALADLGYDRAIRGAMLPEEAQAILAEQRRAPIRGDGSRQAPAHAVAPEAVDVAAARVAPEPSDAQREAGNYQKGHLRWNGLEISIETPKGGVREAADKSWRVEDYPAHYGYLKRTEGADGDAVDVFVGDAPESQRVFVIDQIDPSTGKYDEAKAILGTGSADEALNLYRSAYTDNADVRIGGVTEMSADEFKAWARGGDTKKPLTDLSSVRRAPAAVGAAEKPTTSGEGMRVGAPERPRGPEHEQAVEASLQQTERMLRQAEPPRRVLIPGEGGRIETALPIPGVRADLGLEGLARLPTTDPETGQPKINPKTGKPVKGSEYSNEQLANAIRKDADNPLYLEIKDRVERADPFGFVAVAEGIPAAPEPALGGRREGPRRGPETPVEHERRADAVEDRRRAQRRLEIAAEEKLAPEHSAVAKLVDAELDRRTGVWNQNAYEMEVASGRKPAAVSEVDVAGAGKTNTIFGEPYTDAILKATARVLKSLAGEAGIVFRKGGDEFVIHWYDYDAGQRLHGQIAEALQQAVITVDRNGEPVAQWRGVDHYDGFGKEFDEASAVVYAKKPKEKRLPAGLAERIERGRAEVRRQGVPSERPGVPGGRGEAGAVGGEEDAVVLPPTGTEPKFAVEEGQPLFKPGAQGAPKLPDREAVGVKLREIFRGQRVEDARVTPDSPVDAATPFVVRTPSGKQIFVSPESVIEFNPRSAARHGEGAKAALETGAARVAGSTQALGRDAWVRIVDDGVLPHEIGGHVFLDHFATKAERDFVERTWKQRAAEEGEGRAFDEVFADDYNKWFDDRQSIKNSALRNVFARIRDFFERMKRALGFESRAGLFREIESSRPFDRPGTEQAGAEPLAAARRAPPGQQGLPEIGEDVPQAQPKVKKSEQADLFPVKDLLAPTEARVTEGLEAEGPLFTQEKDAALRKEAKTQDSLKFATTEEKRRRTSALLGRRAAEGSASAQPYSESRLPHRQAVRVTFEDGSVHYDAVKGLNQGHALARARANWDGAKIEPVTMGEARRADPQFADDLERAELAVPKFATAPVPEKGEKPPLGRQIRPDEAPRVEAKVSALGSGVDLSRDAPRTWESLDETIRRNISRVLGSEQAEAMFFEKVRSGRVNDVDVQTMDALITGKRERADASRQAWLRAQETGKGSSGESVEYLKAALDAAVTDYVKAGRADVEGGTKLARALAARARVMNAAVAGDPDKLLRKLLREIPDLTDAQATKLIDTLRDNPSGFQDVLQAALTPTRFDQFLEWWKAGLVSGPGTQVANIAGNVGEQGVRVGETAIGGVLDRLIGGKRVRVSGEAGWEVAGGYAGAKRAMGQLGRALKDIVTLAPEKIDLSQPLERQAGKIPGRLGRGVRISFRLLGAFDDFFKAVGAEAELYKRALRQTGGDKAAAERLLLRDAEDVPALLREHPEIAAEISANVLSRVFQDPNRAAEAIQGLRSRIKLLHVPMPFVQAPANILSRSIERSPAGFIEGAKALRAYRDAVKAGGDAAEIARLKGEAIDKLARPLMGTLILGTFAAVAQAGGMTGSGPTDQKERNALRQGGWQPYSFVVTGPDGRKSYVPFNRFEPVSSLLGFAADMIEAKDQETAGDLFDKALGSVVQNLTSKTYLTGLADAAAAINDPKRFAGQYITNLAGSVIPNIVAKAAQATDESLRDVKPESTGLPGLPERVGKTIASRIPGLSRTLPERRAGTGERIVRPGNVATRFLSPVQPSTETAGMPFQQLLVDLEAVPSAPRREIKVRGRSVPLTAAEYAMLQDADEKATRELRQLTTTRQFLNLPEESQRSAIRNRYEVARSSARNAITRTREFRARAMKAVREAR